MSKFDDLAKLKELFDSGAITNEEYDAERKKILDRPEEAPTQEGTPSEQQASQASVQQAQPQIVINNTNTNMNQNIAGYLPKPKNKWVALLLCIFLGFFGAHKFYEGKIALGVVYIFTGGLFFIGVIVDFFSLLFKPNPYFV